MEVSPIIANRLVTPKTTGYAATAGIVLAAASGLTGNKTLRRIHKPSSFLSILLIALHIGLIEYNNYKWSKKQL